MEIRGVGCSSSCSTRVTSEQWHHQTRVLEQRGKVSWAARWRSCSLMIGSSDRNIWHKYSGSLSCQMFKFLPSAIPSLLSVIPSLPATVASLPLVMPSFLSTVPSLHWAVHSLLPAIPFSPSAVPSFDSDVLSLSYQLFPFSKISIWEWIQRWLQLFAIYLNVKQKWQKRRIS